jgi:Tol biopolymer transport system component
VTRRGTLLVALAVVLAGVAVGVALVVIDDEPEPQGAAPEPPCVVAVPASHPTIIDGGTSIATISADGTRTLLTGEKVANDPDISPDGRRIVYVQAVGDYESSGPERTELWTMGIDGSDPTRIVTDGVYQEAPSWSPDGERIAFARQDREGGLEVAVVPVDGGEATVVARPTPDDGVAGVPSIDWSPDGRRLVYLWSTSGLQSARTEVRVVALDGTGPRTLAEQGLGAQVDWSPDGSSLLLSTFDGTDTSLAVVDATSGATTALPHPGALARWSADGTHVYAITGPGPDDGWELVELPGPDTPDDPVRTIGPTDFPTYGMSVGPGC